MIDIEHCTTLADYNAASIALSEKLAKYPHHTALSSMATTTTTPTAARAVQNHSAAIIKTTLQGCALTAISNVLAQVLSQYRAAGAAPISINATPILHFVLLTILNTPPNFLWQEYLETSFPGHSPPPSTAVSEKGARVTAAPAKKKLNITNTLIKFSLDQTVGAVYNTVAFLVVMQAFKGASAGEIWEVVQRVGFHRGPLQRKT